MDELRDTPRDPLQDTSKSDAQTPGTLDELWDLLIHFDTAMLITVTPEGLLRARPMVVQDPDELEDCDLWFVTSHATGKVDEIQHMQQVGVCCFRQSDKAYLSISARATVERDRATIKRLWRPTWRAWMPGGPEDAEVCLLKLTVERAEYWEPEGGRLRVLYDMLKGLVKNESAEAYLNPPKHIG